jgi:hypothetical protein
MQAVRAVEPKTFVQRAHGVPNPFSLDHTGDPDRRGRDDADVDPRGSEHAEHLGGDPGLLLIPAPINETLAIPRSDARPRASIRGTTPAKILSAHFNSSSGSVNEMSVWPASETFCTIMSTLMPASASGRKIAAATPA